MLVMCAATTPCSVLYCVQAPTAPCNALWANEHAGCTPHSAAHQAHTVIACTPITDYSCLPLPPDVAGGLKAQRWFRATPSLRLPVTCNPTATWAQMHPQLTASPLPASIAVSSHRAPAPASAAAPAPAPTSAPHLDGSLPLPLPPPSTLPSTLRLPDAPTLALASPRAPASVPLPSP